MAINEENCVELKHGKYLGFGKLIDIDSYILEDGENLKIKYRLHIEDLDGNIFVYSHNGGKPKSAVYKMINSYFYYKFDDNKNTYALYGKLSHANINNFVEQRSKLIRVSDAAVVMSILGAALVFIVGFISYIMNPPLYQVLLVMSSLLVLMIAPYSYERYLVSVHNKSVLRSRDDLHKSIIEWVERTEDTFEKKVLNIVEPSELEMVTR